MSFVTAYRKDTGQRVSIPEHWLGHPTLGKPFRKTAPSRPASGSEPVKGKTAPAAGDAEKE